MTRTILLISLGLLSFGATAAPDDFSAPIEIEAQRVEVDAQNGSSVYQGNVKLVRGSMEIHAEKMTLTQLNDEVSADIQGSSDKLAEFSQINENGERMQAKAQRIRYFSDQDAIEFDGNAEIKRAADTVSSDHIRYDLRAEQILAGGGKNTGDGNNRVHIVIQPAASKADTGSTKE